MSYELINPGAKRDEDLDRFGSYLVLERVASGGMAEIFKVASTTDPDQRYALKRIRSDCDEEDDFRNMLKDEAKIASVLRHENIVRVFDVVQHEDQLGLLMEYVDGVDLGRLKRHLKNVDAALPTELAIHIVRQVLEALDYAHGARDTDGQYLHVVHRDVSPGNVMIDVDGRVRLVDFGIARAQNRLAKTEAGNVKGKFRYMAPEQIQGEAVGPVSDVYSTAIVLWELLAGRRIYDDLSVAQLMSHVAEANVPNLDEARSGLSKSLQRVFHKATAARPQDRYSSARAFAEALDSVMLEYDVNSCRLRLSAIVLEAHTKDSRRNFKRAVERARVAAEHDLEDAILNALESPDRVERVDADSALNAETSKSKKNTHPEYVAAMDEPPTMKVPLPLIRNSSLA